MAALPPAYAWLDSFDTLPRVIVEGLKLLGTVEVPGPNDSPIILAWARELGLARVYSDDAIPWCGLFAAIVAKRAGKDVPGNPLWARNWAKFGVPSPDASLGDVLVFERPGGGGHVGFYIAEDATAYHVLGGNQSDRVCITRIKRDRCIAVRRPVMKVAPATVRPFVVAVSGTISTNEA